jgi:hypothetical protein
MSGPTGPGPFLFLDCDGVLAGSRVQNATAEDPSLVHADPSLGATGHALKRLDGGSPSLERRCLVELQRIVRRTGAQCVLTTTWRHDAPLRSFLVAVLAEYEIPVIGDTADLSDEGGGRGDEVAAYLEANVPEGTAVEFVAIDDSDAHVANFQQALPPGRWVQTALENTEAPELEGLTAAFADVAIRILLPAAADEAARGRVAALADALASPAEGGSESSLPSCKGVGARVIFGRQGDEASFAHLSGSSQPWPFVAGADHELLLKGRRSHLELLNYIGFEADWVTSKIAGGTVFRMVLFAMR